MASAWLLSSDLAWMDRQKDTRTYVVSIISVPYVWAWNPFVWSVRTLSLLLLLLLLLRLMYCFCYWYCHYCWHCCWYCYWYCRLASLILLLLVPLLLFLILLPVYCYCFCYYYLLTYNSRVMKLTRVWQIRVNIITREFSKRVNFNNLNFLAQSF